MDFPEARKFLTASFHDLPNVLFVGSLILGSLLGYLPLVWVALGMLLNGAVTSGLQLFVKFLIDSIPPLAAWDRQKRQLTVPYNEYMSCYVGFKTDVDNFLDSKSLTSSTNPVAAPSHWMSAVTFFTAFSIYNSIRVLAREPNKQVDPKLIKTRTAFSLSTLIIGFFFIGLVFARLLATGCETMTGGVLGMVVGTAVAISFWHTLDSCGTGKLPDILQVVGSMAPERSKTMQPVMCVPPRQ